ncbi:DUF3048 domain-containing protein [Caldicellulosiruptoraceae bacterium PP1]
MKKRATIIFILIFILILSGCSSKTVSTKETNNDNMAKSNVVSNTYQKQPEIVQNICYFTGNEYNNDHYIFAVMINNELGAIPQSSLNEAEMLYEALIEGGATRIMAIYHHTYPKKIGPIRSARPYFMQIAKSLNAYYVHCGGSPQSYRLIRNKYIKDIDAIYIGNNIFFRTTDRKAPHNLYSSQEKLISYAKKKGFDKNQAKDLYKFTDSFSNVSNGDNSEIIIRFSGWYNIKYKYDSSNLKYLRYIKQKPHIDKETNEQIYAKNIVILKAHYNTIRNDDKGRQEVDFSNGSGYLIQEGKTVNINYTFDLNNSFKLTDSNGKEINLLKGNTWFELVPQYGDIQIK